MSKCLSALAVLLALAGARRPPPTASSTSAAPPRRRRSPAGTSTCAPDGQGLPPGKGSVKDGEEVYMASAPPATASSAKAPGAGRWSRAGRARSKSDDPVKTVGSYFAHLSTVIDYVRRAMPFGDAQSLTNDELYAVVAYMLYLNDIVDEKFVLSKETFAGVKMPNAAGFYDDDRETAEKSFWATPCMTNCKADVKITGRARVIDVTPDDKSARKGVD